MNSGPVWYLRVESGGPSGFQPTGKRQALNLEHAAPVWFLTNGEGK